MALIPAYENIEAARDSANEAALDYLASQDYSEAFSSIMDENKIHIDERGNIAEALEATFYELISADKFSDALNEALEQNKDKHGAVLSAINEKIFKPYRESWEEKVESQNVTAPAKQTAPAAANQAPVVANQPTQAPKIILEKSSNEKPESVLVDAFSESESDVSKTQSKPEYRSGVDPYREPIE